MAVFPVSRCINVPIRLEDTECCSCYHSPPNEVRSSGRNSYRIADNPRHDKALAVVGVRPNLPACRTPPGRGRCPVRWLA
jgi:hypothetical protein